MEQHDSVSWLVQDYRSLFGSLDGDPPDLLEKTLVWKGDWTPLAAEHLTRLAREYGSFMLRNALAISLALGIQDGELGF